MNNFTTPTSDSTDETATSTPKIPKHLESLTTSVFQSLFPPINPTTTSLKGIKRVLLLDRIPQAPDAADATYTLDLRHYAIETRTAKSVAKPLRRLDAAAQRLAHTARGKRNAVPNLGRLADVADYLLDPDAADGFTSGSESEPETDAEVEIVSGAARRAQKPRTQRGEGGGEGGDGGSGERRERRAEVERKAIKLHELGPRMRLRLTKVEEGVCGGKVMWHEYIHKSKEEIKQMEKLHEKRRQEKERRKAEQKANVERKKAEKKARGKTGQEGEEGEEEDDEMDWRDDFDDEDDVWEGEADMDEDEDEDTGEVG